MSLNIKNSETVELAHALAAATGDTVTGAITQALRDRLDRITGESRRRSDQLRTIATDAAGRWTEPWRSADHGSLLYDDQGLPK